MTRQTRSSFPLRLRNQRTRAFVALVSEQEHISQNELIEQAIEHELVVRGALVADDLANAAERIRVLSDEHYGSLVERSIELAAAGEALLDPLSARALRTADREERPAITSQVTDDPLGALSAFRTAAQ